MILEPAQINVRANGARAQHCQKIVGDCHDNDFFTNGIKGGIFDCRFPAVESGTGFIQNDVRHDVTPGAGDQFGINCGEIRHADLAVDVRILQGLVFGLDETLSFFLVSSL
jgi:hypothetical protein